MAARDADDGDADADAEAEERRALELELAAALAALSAQDVGLDETLEPLEGVTAPDDVEEERGGEADYVRVDLDALLRSEAERDGADERTRAATWPLLLQTVARSERDFFGRMSDELVAIRASLLAPKSPPNKTEAPARRPAAQHELQDERAARDPRTTLQSAPDASNARAEAQMTSETLRPAALEARQAAREEERRAEAELRAIAKRHAARDARRCKAQQQRREAREQTDKRLLELQEDFAVHERNVAAATREADECGAMAAEELRGRVYAAAEREARELALVAREDALSRLVEAEVARRKACAEAETAQMQAEERAARQRMRMEQQLRHQEERGLARCRFGAVVLELQDELETRRRRREQDKKRERREGVQMRCEEAQRRRVVAHERLVREHKTRGRERAAMEHEDGVARALVARERERVDQERCCLAMSLEDEHSRVAWTRLAAQALEEERRREVQQQRRRDDVFVALEGLTSVARRHGVAYAWTKWRHWHRERLEAEKARAAAEEAAARRLQTWMRSLRRRLDALDRATRPSELRDVKESEDESQDATTESQEAARRVQSTFRGFHVRRKFANALALAQTVEGDVLDAFDAVDLEDLIQLPPELDDGWETPVLPPVSTSTLTRNEQQQERWEDATSQEDEATNQEDEGGQDALEAADRPEEDTSVVSEAVSRVPNEGAAPAKETNLAATLWSKMRRVKQRQQHAKQERQRQQDPTYRVQKLLHRQPSRRSGASTSHNNQSSHSQPQTSQGAQRPPNTVAWSATSNTKKRPKVKLPSLVERLRKQTLAAR